MIQRLHILFLFFLSIGTVATYTSCLRDELELKPDKSLIVPKTVADYQALLDYQSTINDRHPWLGEVASDDYYVLESRLNAVRDLERNAYVWQEDVYNGVNISLTGVLDWMFGYQQIYYANIVLTGLDKLSNEKENQQYGHTKGSALFYRAHAYWWLSQTFCKVYDMPFADSDLGLPLRTDPDPLKLVNRSTLQETYDLIISDLKESIQFLDDVTATPTRPTKKAALGLLARVYLSMRNYENASYYANHFLDTYSALMDYNQFEENIFAPFPEFYENPEVVYHAWMSGSQLVVHRTHHLVDTLLYKSYHPDDLRKSLFFSTAPNSGLIVYNGSYRGSGYHPWGGIATDEIYLIRAECRARQNDVTGALNDLNALLETRWRSGTFIPFTASSTEGALQLILSERRKELIFRGLRWMDLRRLNKEGANITLRRVVNGQTYTLPPNDPRYVYPIPPYELQHNPMPDNDRSPNGGI